MKLEDIQIGYPYTYSELCSVLGEEELRGTSFYNQQQRWKDKFMFHCIGSTKSRRFIVDKILEPIIVLYAVGDKMFSTKEEAENYRRGVINND